MNKRQKKKAFKKRFGFNPPRNMSIKTATWVMERKEKIIAVFQKVKDAIWRAWKALKQYLDEFFTALIRPLATTKRIVERKGECRNEVG